ncbi:MAG TPA: ABC transporter permease, partial [Chloroflexota bacterium]|nr:ABC transporter permease [Chloroflexota bacterium]
RGLFSGSESPLGQTVRIAAVPFTVVGVLAAQSGGSLDTSTNAVLIPFQSGQIRLFGAAPLGEIVLQTADASQTQSMVVQIQRVLRTRHQIQAGQSDGFTITLANSLGTSAKGPLDNLAARVVNLSQQYACVAKALC